MNTLTADLPTPALTAPTAALPERSVVGVDSPAASVTFAHFSGLHIAESGTGWPEMEAVARLAAALHHLESLRVPVDALVFAGDLAEFGEPAAYALLQRIVEPVADRLGAQVVWCAGESDDRVMARAVLRGGPAGTFDEVVDVGGMRVISLDSTAWDARSPRVDEAQMFWLSGVLALPAARGSILVLHHPLLPGFEVVGADLLRPILAGSDVRMVMSGCVPAAAQSMFAGVPVSAAGPVSFARDVEGIVDGAPVRFGLPTFNLVRACSSGVLSQTVTVGAVLPLV